MGHGLVGHLVNDGAIVYLTDIHDDKLAAVEGKVPGVNLVKPEAVFMSVDMDVYSPCALGVQQ